MSSSGFKRKSRLANPSLNAMPAEKRRRLILDPLEDEVTQDVPAASAAPSGTAAAAAPIRTAEEQQRIIQQQLLLILHSHKCQQRDRLNPNRPPCTVPHCQVMKELLCHMTGCSIGSDCTYIHCCSSKQIIRHWLACQRVDCLVCGPLLLVANSTPLRERG